MDMPQMPPKLLCEDDPRLLLMTVWTFVGGMHRRALHDIQKAPAGSPCREVLIRLAESLTTAGMWLMTLAEDDTCDLSQAPGPPPAEGGQDPTLPDPRGPQAF